MELLTLTTDKNWTNDEKVHFSKRFFESEYMNEIVKKSTLRKFLSAYYGKEVAEEMIDKFWSTSKFIIGEGNDIVTIAWSESGPTFPVKKLAKFLAKTMPEVKLHESTVENIPRIDFIKYVYARAIISEIGDSTVSLASELSVDEVEQLVDLSLTMGNGHLYHFVQFDCDTCREHDEGFPIHLEFQPL